MTSKPFTFPLSYRKKQVNVPLGHPDALRLGRRRTSRDIRAAIETNTLHTLRPDPFYIANVDAIVYDSDRYREVNRYVARVVIASAAQ